MLADVHGRSAYDHLFHSGQSLSKIKDAALGGRLFDVTVDFASTGVPGRSLAWKVRRFLPFSFPSLIYCLLTPRSIDLSYTT